jgi:hypothetical protein
MTTTTFRADRGSVVKGAFVGLGFAGFALVSVGAVVHGAKPGATVAQARGIAVSSSTARVHPP